MLLAKSCKPEHNIKTSKTIRVGSLNEYRTTENLQIADKGEGTITFSLHFDGEVEVPIRFYNLISGAASQIIQDGYAVPDHSFPGHSHCYWEHERYQIRRNGFITLIDSSAIITRKAFNSFVFCMSEVRDELECKNMFEDYSDSWLVPKERAEYWLRGVNYLLHKRIKEEHDLGNYITPKGIPPEELVMRVAHRPVTYQPRDIRINNQNPHNFEEVINSLAHISFTKPEDPFAKEKEYRFEFIITHKGAVIEPSVNSIILDVPELLPVVL